MITIKPNVEIPDYHELVDPDIASVFDDKDGFFLGDVLMAQIIKELKILNGKLNNG